MLGLGLWERGVGAKNPGWGATEQAEAVGL